MTTALALALLATALVVALPWLAVVRIREGQVAVLRRSGRTRKVLLPGLHWVMPGLDRIELRLDSVGHSVELREHKVPLAGQGLRVDGRVYYQILDARKAAPELDHLEQTVTRTLDDLLPAFVDAHRDDPAESFNVALKHSMNERLRGRGILVARTQIQAA